MKLSVLMTWCVMIGLLASVARQGRRRAATGGAGNNSLGGKVGVHRRTVLRVLFKDPKVTDAALDNLKGFNRLMLLDLGNTRITDEGLAKLEEFKELTSLNLESTQITDAGLKNYAAGLTKMQVLNLDHTQVTDAGLAELKGMLKLQTLKLTGTTIGDAGLANLRPLAKLENLGLGGTHITDAGLVALKGVTTTLDLGSTHITDAGLAHLKAAFGAGEPGPRPYRRHRCGARKLEGPDEHQACRSPRPK